MRSEERDRERERERETHAIGGGGRSFEMATEDAGLLPTIILHPSRRTKFFAEVTLVHHGRSAKRLYAGQPPPLPPQRIEGSGSSHTPAEVPGTGWFAQLFALRAKARLPKRNHMNIERRFVRVGGGTPVVWIKTHTCETHRRSLGVCVANVRGNEKIDVGAKETLPPLSPPPNNGNSNGHTLRNSNCFGEGLVPFWRAVNTKKNPPNKPGPETLENYGNIPDS